MLLADLGADVVKVEPPRGDEWRRYDPFEEGESRYFYALNRGKRSVALDLKTEDGRARSRELIAGADALVHNCLPERARRFGLDRDERARREPALRDGLRVGLRQQRARRRAARLRPDRPGALGTPARRASRRATPCRAGPAGSRSPTSPPGCSPALAVAAGLLGRGERAAEIEVSLLGAALALQAQRFVAVDGRDDPRGRRSPTPT